MANVNVQRSNWMLGVVDSTPLYQMSIPGTHETCALHGGGPTQCQWHSVTALLDRGVRFLDIRCVHAKGSLGSKEFPIYHNTIYQETNFQDVQTECTNFLTNNPSECILMNVQHEQNDALENRSGESFLEMFLTLYDSNYWIFPNTIPKLDDCRKKIVLIRAYDPKTNHGWPASIPNSAPAVALPGGGGLAWNGFDNDGYSYNTHFETQNGWSKYNDVGDWDAQNAEKVRVVKQYLVWAAEGRAGVDRIYVNFLSRAAGAYVGSAAEVTNKAILQYLRTEHTDPSKRLGVLPIDFVGNTDQEAERLEDVIIRRNPFKPGYQFV